MKQFKWLQRLSFELLCSPSDYFFFMEIWSKMFVNINVVFRTVATISSVIQWKSNWKSSENPHSKSIERHCCVYVIYSVSTSTSSHTIHMPNNILFNLCMRKNPVNELVYNQSGLVNSLVLMPFACYRIHQVSATSSQWASAQLMQFIQFTVECTQITESTP